MPNREETIHRSKAVGEPPLMLGLSVFHALRNAVASTGDGRASPCLDAPATSEAILMALTEMRERERMERLRAAPAKVALK